VKNAEGGEAKTSSRGKCNMLS